MAAGTWAVRPTTMSEKKMPMESGMPSIWQVARMPEATPRSRAGTLFMMAAVLGAANMPKATPFRKITPAKRPVGEVRRQGHEQQEAERGEQHAGGGEGARAVAVGKDARDRTGDEEAQPSAAACRCRPTAASVRSCSRAAAARCPAAT